MKVVAYALTSAYLCQLINHFCQLTYVSLFLSAYFCQLISDLCMYILNRVTGKSMADINTCCNAGTLANHI